MAPAWGSNGVTELVLVVHQSQKNRTVPTDKYTSWSKLNLQHKRHCIEV